MRKLHLKKKGILMPKDLVFLVHVLLFSFVIQQRFVVIFFRIFFLLLCQWIIQINIVISYQYNEKRKPWYPLNNYSAQYIQYNISSFHHSFLSLYLSLALSLSLLVFSLSFRLYCMLIIFSLIIIKCLEFLFITIRLH